MSEVSHHISSMDVLFDRREATLDLLTLQSRSKGRSLVLKPTVRGEMTKGKSSDQISLFEGMLGEKAADEMLRSVIKSNHLVKGLIDNISM